MALTTKVKACMNSIQSTGTSVHYVLLRLKYLFLAAWPLTYIFVDLKVQIGL